MCFTTENWDDTKKMEVLEYNTLARLRYFADYYYGLLLYQQWSGNLPNMLEEHLQKQVLFMAIK